MPTRPKPPFRHVQDLRKMGVLSVASLGRYRHNQVMPGLDPHRHPDGIELCYLVRGYQVYEVGGQHYRMRGGDVFLTVSGETHSTGGEPQDKGLLYWICFLDPKRSGGCFLGHPKSESLALWNAILKLKRRHFFGGNEIKGLFDRLFELTSMRAGALTRLQLTNQLTSLLFGVLEAHDRTMGHRISTEIQIAIDSMRAHLDSPDIMAVPILAQRAGLSASRFQARFKNETGVPPAEFALRLRIDEAARRLKLPGASVTSVAFGLGFSSSQHFASAFRRMTNSSPRDWLVKAGRRSARLGSNQARL